MKLKLANAGAGRHKAMCADAWALAVQRPGWVLIKATVGTYYLKT